MVSVFLIITLMIMRLTFFFISQGRYIPLFAAEVYDQNSKLVDAGLTPINLTSIMIGMNSTH